MDASFGQVLRLPLRSTRPLRVRVVAPSSPFAEEKLAQGIARLQEANVEVERCSDLHVNDHAYLNGGDEVRLKALQQALRADVDVVWLARGGYGLTRLLSQLVLPPCPMPVVVGFSDATALLAWLHQRGVPSVHGPLATTLAGETQPAFDHVLRVLQGEHPPPLANLRVREAMGERGIVEGRVFAGNLCVLSHLVGTPHLPTLDGHILLLEEVGERPYRIDRMLTQMLDAGVLRGVKAIVVGHMIGCDEPGQSQSHIPPPLPIDVIAERCRGLGCPVVDQGAFGHASPNFAIPNGVLGRLRWEQENASLHFDSSLFHASRPQSVPNAESPNA